MGCLVSKFFGTSESAPEDIDNNTQAQPQYSWDTRPRIDPKDFTIDGLIDGLDGRFPGKINGQQFIIQNCQNSSIYLYDHINMITVDDCINCSFIIGPVKTSIFVRDCKDCKFVVACQQFRTRDCQKLDVSLSCVSQPIIESSTKIRFGPYQLFYPELEDQFRSSGLSPFNCTWSEIHDFTPVSGEAANYSLLPVDKLPIVVPPSSTPANSGGDCSVDAAGVGLAALDIRTDRERWVVPWTQGKRPWEHDGEQCLMVIFTGDDQEGLARRLIDRVIKLPNCVVMDTRQTTIQSNDCGSIFGTDQYDSQVQRGPVITLNVSGPGIQTQCQEFARELIGSDDISQRLFISRDHESTRVCLDALFNLINMQMNTQ